MARRFVSPGGLGRAARLALAAAILAASLGEASAEPAAFRLLDAQGRPVAFARLSLFGRTGAAATDAEGIFSLSPLPRPPFRLNVFSSEGEFLGVLRVERLQEEGTQDLRLPLLERLEVTVRTGVAPSTIAPPAAGGTVLSRGEREQRQPGHVNEILQEVPGTSTVGPGHAAVPSVRGLARGRTLILLDDARITSERRAGPSATFLDPFSLESLEVVRGPGSVVYGSDALGGIIHGRTPVPTPAEVRGRYEAGGGIGVPMATGAAEVNLPAGGGALLLQAHQRAFGDYEAPSGEVADSGARDRGVLVKSLLRGRRARWVLGLQVDQGRDVGKPRQASDDSETRYPEEDSARLTATAILPPPGPLNGLELHLFAGRYSLVTEREESPAGGRPGALDRSEVESGDASVRLIASLPAGPGAARFGLDASSRFGLSAATLSVGTDPNTGARFRTEERPIDSADRIDAGAFLETERPLAAGRVTLSGGMRGQGIWTSDGGGERRSSGALTGYGAATVALGGGWSATLQGARGFREPTLSDRYYTGVTGRGFIEGNPDLDPEYSEQFDLSARWSGAQGRLAAYLYHYTILDLVERYRRATGDFAFRNRGEAEIQGVELEAEREWRGGLSVRLALNQARGTDREDGTALADIPPLRARLSVGKRHRDRIWWRAEVDYTWRDDHPGPTEAETPGYGTLDLSAGISVGGGVEVRLIGANVLDREHPASADDDSVPAPGRSAALIVAGTF